MALVFNKKYGKVYFIFMMVMVFQNSCIEKIIFKNWKFY